MCKETNRLQLNTYLRAHLKIEATPRVLLPVFIERSQVKISKRGDENAGINAPCAHASTSLIWTDAANGPQNDSCLAKNNSRKRKKTHIHKQFRQFTPRHRHRHRHTNIPLIRTKNMERTGHTRRSTATIHRVETKRMARPSRRSKNGNTSAPKPNARALNNFSTRSEVSGETSTDACWS